MPNTSTFAPNSFFFTDPALITQDASQAFGPASEDVFQLTSKFTLTADANAYAICTGIVLVQPQSDSSDLVNLILRPFKQPITGLNIKYFVYRGLSIGDFFDGSTGNVIPAGSDTSDFINKINASFAAYYTSTGATAPDFLGSFIGFDPTNQPDTMMISDLFFKTSNYTNGTETAQTAFELPLITAGASLGQFVAGECGIDVVLDYGDYQLPTPNDQFVFNLDYARDSEATIDLAAVTDDFQQQLLKEQIFQFIDVAAYYGFHYSNGTVITGGASGNTSNKADAIYTSVVQKFSTKNNLYLYIQSDRTRSYNFYGNYQISDTDTNTLNMGLTADTLAESTYATNGWPILINSTPQNVTGNANSLYIQFVTDNNPNTILYGQVAQIVNDTGNNFCGPDDLIQPANADGSQSTLTEVIQLSNPATGPDGAKLNVATFNILLYQGQTYDYVAGQTTDDDGNTTNVTAQPAFFDDVFGELNATPLQKTDDDSGYSAVSTQRIKLINHFYDNNQYGISAVQTLIVNDTIDTDDDTTPTLARVIYISESVDILNDVVSIAGTVTADTKSNPSASGSVTDSNTYTLPDPFYFNLTTFTDDTSTITALELESTDGSIPSKIILGLTKDENDLLIGLITSNSFTNARLFLVDQSDDGTGFTSQESINYQKYNAGIVGETPTGDLKLALSDNGIIVYSLDRKYHFSKGYTDYFVDQPIPALSLDTNISIDLIQQSVE